MRIELVSPAAEDSARLTPLALATLAALIPPDVEVGFSDDQFGMLPPYPGTRLYSRLRAGGRLLRDQWWLVPNQEVLAPHYRPKLMEPEQLREGWKRAWKEFYTFSSIRKRMDFWPALYPYLAYLPLNLRQYYFARHKICDENTRPRAWKENLTKK